MPEDFKGTVFQKTQLGSYILAKNDGKLSISQLIMVQRENIVDPDILYQMGWI